ncbi:MAG: carboxypeptidase regulatory-like domain-containing protein, partial [Bdellovibrio sp.]
MRTSLLSICSCLLVLLTALSSGAANSETYVIVQANNPTLKYQAGQQAVFSIFEVAPWTGLLDVEVFYQSETSPLPLTDMSTFKTVQTPVLELGPTVITFKVYEIEEELHYLLKDPRRTLLEEFEIAFNVRPHDNTPPTLSFLPEADTVFIDDMPFIQVSYADAPAGVDTNTFQATLIDEWGARTDITSLFTVTGSFATVQFDESHKLPVGASFLEIQLADLNENAALQTLRYIVEVPVPTSGYFIGQVVDAVGNPVENAEVEVSSGGVINLTSETTTDTQGNFRLPVGQGGDILLTATKAGWTSQAKWIVGQEGKDTAVPTFTIKPLDVNLTFISKLTGGIATNADNTVQFVVQPNSASDDIYLNITQARSGNELPGALPILSEFTYMGTMGPSGTTFSPPGKLRIKNELNFPPNTPIVVGMYNKETGVWEDSGSDGMVSSNGEYVEYDMPHFSSWDANQPVVPPVDQQPSATSSNPDVEGNGCKRPGCRLDVEKGNLGVDYELPGVVRYGVEYKPVFSYWSQSAHPLLVASAQQFFRWLAFGDHPDLIQVEMSLGNIYKRIFYKGKGSINSGDTTYNYRMVMDAKGADGQYLPTGVYDFDVSIGNDYKNSRFATALYFGAPPLTPLDTITPEPVSLKYNIKSRSIVLNSRNSPFGKGWTLQGLEKLTFGTDSRIIWEDGTGVASLYTGIPAFQSSPIKFKQKNRDITSLSLKNVQALEQLNATSVIERGGSFIVADCSSNQVYAIGLDGRKSVIAGTGAAGFRGDGGAATLAQLSCPSSIYASYDGGLLIADRDNGRIRKVSSQGIITTIAGMGAGGASNNGLKALHADIGRPTFVSEDKLHSIHFITGDKIRFVDPRGRLQTLVAPEGGYYKAALKDPTQIVYDEKDNLTVVDKGNNRIIKIFLQSGEVRVLAGETETRGAEKVTRTVEPSAGTPLEKPISFVRDRKAQVSYVLDEAGSVHVITHDGRLLKTDLKSKLKNLILSYHAGLVGARNSKDLLTYVSPSGDFSTLVQLPSGGFVRTQPNGYTSIFNEYGVLTEKTTPDGRNETFTYDSKGRLLSWALPSGDDFDFTYDMFSGRLKEVMDPAGRITKFTINNAGQLVKIEDPQGGEKEYTYNSLDLMTSESLTSDPNIKGERLANLYNYSANGVINQKTHPDGSVQTLKTKMDLNLQTATKSGEGTFESPAEPPVYAGNPGEEVSAGNRKWNFNTDKFGGVTDSVDGLGRKTVMTRDADGLVSMIREPLGGFQSFFYNNLGLPTSIRNQDGRVKLIQYTNFAKVSMIRDELTRETHFTYNNQGNITEIRDPLLRTTTFEYAPKGLVTKVTDAASSDTVFTYNAQGLVATMTDALNNTTTYAYNGAGLVTAVTDALSRTTTYQYDNLNRLTKAIDPLDGETRFTYSAKGELLTLTDPKNQTTTYTYNDRGQVLSAKNALNQTETYTYDPDGLMLTKTRRDGSVIYYSYDQARQLTRIGAPDEETKFNYDPNGNLIWIGNGAGSISRQYSVANRLQSETQNGATIQYLYNAVGMRTSLALSGHITQYTYNPLNVLTGIQSQISGGTYQWTRSLDVLSRPVQDILPSGVQINRAFTDLSQLASLSNIKANTDLISSFAYQYDDVGKRISNLENIGVLNSRNEVEVHSSNSQYTYDDLNRLTEVSSPREAFSYDVVGNRQFGGGTSHNVLNQLLSDGGRYTFEYSLNGDLKKKVNILTGEETHFTWSTESRLLSIQVKVGATVKRGIFYRYDGLGRRIERQVADYVDTTRSSFRRFIYDGNQIIEERDLNEIAVARYMNGPGIDDPILVSRKEGVFEFTKDGLGSIRELIKSDGNPIQRYRYSAYGVTTQELQE